MSSVSSALLSSGASWSWTRPIRATSPAGWWLVLQEMLEEGARIMMLTDPDQNLCGRDCRIPSDVFSGMVPCPFTLNRNYSNAYEIAVWLKGRHSAAAEPGEHLPSSENAVQIHHWKTQEEQQQKLMQAIEQLEFDGFKPDYILLLTPFKLAKSESLQVFASEMPAYAGRRFNIYADR